MVRHLILLALLWPPAGLATPQDDARQLIDASQAQVRIDPERSRDLAERALAQLARLTPTDAELQLRAWLLLCDYHSERDRVATERDIAAARALLPQVKRSGLGAGVLGCEGALREGEGASTEALALYDRAVTIAEQTQENELLADALFQRGYLRGVRGEFAAGLADLKRGHRIAEEQRLAVPMLSIESAIASLYSRLGDYAQARRYYEAALKAQTSAGLRREEAVTRNDLGRVYENLKDFDRAAQAFDAARALSRQIAYARSEAYALRGLASVANAGGQPDAAIAWLDEATRLQGAAPDERLRAQILLQRGIALRLTMRYAQSADALEAARAIFARAEALAELARTQGEIAATRADLGDWQAALEAHHQFKRVSDQLMAQQLDDRFATLRVEVDGAAREQEMRLLQREQVATEYALSQARAAAQARGIAIGLGAVLLALLAAFAWRQRRTSAAMRQLAMTDALTGLPNRRDVIARLEAQLAGTEPACALLIIDIDHFKQVNDGHGHAAGDEVLRAVAQALRSACRDPVCVGRFGGEEFLVLLPGHGLDAGRAVAERLRANVEALDVSQSAPGAGVTISAGVATSEPGDDAVSLLRRADAALYEAKASGRNRVVTAT